MKITLSSVFTLIFSAGLAQDSLQKEERQPRIHELGVNITLFSKQIINLSNNIFDMLPYDVTYYTGRKSSWGLRVGLGLDLEMTETTTTVSGSNVTPGPDPVVPSYSNRSQEFFRIGLERRIMIERRLVCGLGLDIAGSFLREKLQTISVFNNLPTSYNYVRTTVTGSATEIGAGPVLSIHYRIGKRTSLSTEIPFYFLYTVSKEVTDDYSNFYNGFSWTSTNDKETIESSGMTSGITIPVTLYLNIKLGRR